MRWRLLLNYNGVSSNIESYYGVPPPYHTNSSNRALSISL
jgi:hypothetical protein